MNTKKPLLKQLPIDENLTPENATSHGFEWVGNIAYDREAPLKEMKEIIDLIDNEGHKLGRPLSKMVNNLLHGLYKPLPEHHS